MSGATTQRTAKVSVVLPTFRRPQLLERALRAVFDQTYDDWEIIVVDDNGAGSEAQILTAEAVRTHSDDPRLRYIVHEVNRGGGAARNTAIELARGTYLAFLDDDDAWSPEKLAEQVACLDASADRVALAYCRSRVVDEATGAATLWKTDGVSHTLRDLLRRNTIGSTSVVMARRSAVLDIGSFDDRLPAKQDVDLYVRLAQKYEFAFVDRTLHTVYRHQGASIGKDLGGKILAHEIFYDKHRTLIESYPEVHHYRLVAMAKLYAADGRYADAWPLLMRAWRLRPTGVRALVDVLGSSKALQRPVGTIRGLVRRGRKAPTRPPQLPGEESS